MGRNLVLSEEQILKKIALARRFLLSPCRSWLQRTIPSVRHGPHNEESAVALNVFLEMNEALSLIRREEAGRTDQPALKCYPVMFLASWRHSIVRCVTPSNMTRWAVELSGECSYWRTPFWSWYLLTRLLNSIIKKT